MTWFIYYIFFFRKYSWSMFSVSKRSVISSEMGEAGLRAQNTKEQTNTQTQQRQQTIKQPNKYYTKQTNRHSDVRCTSNCNIYFMKLLHRLSEKSLVLFIHILPWNSRGIIAMHPTEDHRISASFFLLFFFFFFFSISFITVSCPTRAL